MGCEMKEKFSKKITPYLLLLPVTLLLVVFLFGLIDGIAQSFGYAPFMNMTEFTTTYYEQAIADANIWSSLGYSFYLAIICTSAATIGAIVLSAALTRLTAGSRLQTFALNLPLSVAHIVVVVLIIVMCGSSGMIARVLYAFGIIDSAQSIPSVIGAESGWGIVLVFMFKEIPYIALSTLAIMMHIGKKYSEAAICLGASPLRTFFHITLPLCKNSIARAALVVFAFAFGSYEIPFLLGPTSPKTIAVRAFFEFQNNDITNRCYAMTIITIIVAITLVIAIVYFVMMNRERKEVRNA
jgi:putative spermidine/putrescine transport system permease protein